MKKLFLLIITLLTVTTSFSQSKVLDGIVDFKIKNTGAIVDINKDVDGYFLFYEIDKISRKERQYAINLLDKNLNDVATKKFTETKQTKLLSSAFNNQVTAFALYDNKNKTFKLIGYDTKANPTKEKEIILDKKVSQFINISYRQGTLQNPLFPIDNKGFLINMLSINKNRFGYHLIFHPTNGGNAWEYVSKNKEKHHHSVNVAAANEKYIVLVDINYRKPSKKTFNTIVLDVNTGKELFSKEFSMDNPRLISNSFITDEGNIVFLGQYYEPQAKIHKAQSLGLYTEIYNKKGDLLFENKMSWAEDVSGKLDIKRESKIKKVGYIFFHDIIRTKDGSFYAIGEQYRKTASAGGIAISVLSAAAGGGVSTSGYTQLTIKDAYIFKFDKQFKLIDIEIFEKGKSRLQNIYDFGSPQLNAFQIKAMGGFDYIYSQMDKENDRFYANFIDYDREGDDNRRKFVLKSIVYDEGELSEDKIPLKKPSKRFRILPGKLGHILLLEYDKKKKVVDLHLEKINIE